MELGFFAGEPLMYFDIIAKRLILEPSEICKEIGKDFSVHFTSNGALLTRNRIGYLEAEGQVHYNKAKLEKRNSSKLSKEICKSCRIAPLCGGGCKQRAIEDPRDGHCTMNYTEELKDKIILDIFEHAFRIEDV